VFNFASVMAMIQVEPGFITKYFSGLLTLSASKGTVFLCFHSFLAQWVLSLCMAPLCMLFLGAASWCLRAKDAKEGACLLPRQKTVVKESASSSASSALIDGAGDQPSYDALADSEAAIAEAELNAQPPPPQTPIVWQARWMQCCVYVLM
jgi:hypothetical protein